MRYHLYRIASSSLINSTIHDQLETKLLYYDLFCMLMLLGLVGQQIDSFDEFIRYTIQELVYDTGEITMTPEDQYIIGQDVAQVHILIFLFFVSPSLFMQLFSILMSIYKLLNLSIIILYARLFTDNVKNSFHFFIRVFLNKILIMRFMSCL